MEHVPASNLGKRGPPHWVDLVFAVGGDVTIVSSRRAGMSGIVVHVTHMKVVIVDDAGFRHWFDCSDIIHTFGSFW